MKNKNIEFEYPLVISDQKTLGWVNHINHVLSRLELLTGDRFKKPDNAFRDAMHTEDYWLRYSMDGDYTEIEIRSEELLAKREQVISYFKHASNLCLTFENAVGQDDMFICTEDKNIYQHILEYTERHPEEELYQIDSFPKVYAIYQGIDSDYDSYLVSETKSTWSASMDARKKLQDAVNLTEDSLEQLINLHTKDMASSVKGFYWAVGVVVLSIIFAPQNAIYVGLAALAYLQVESYSTTNNFLMKALLALKTDKTREG